MSWSNPAYLWHKSEWFWHNFEIKQKKVWWTFIAFRIINLKQWTCFGRRITPTGTSCGNLHGTLKWLDEIVWTSLITRISVKKYKRGPTQVLTYTCISNPLNNGQASLLWPAEWFDVGGGASIITSRTHHMERWTSKPDLKYRMVQNYIGLL